MRWHRPKRPKPKSTPLSRRLARRLREAGATLPMRDEEYVIARHTVGYWQRSAGAWVWSLDLPDFYDTGDRVAAQVYGSRWPASECAAKGVTLERRGHGDVEAVPIGTLSL